MDQPQEITIDDFAKVTLQVGKIVSAEKMENSDKLLTFQVDLGTKKVQILSGIAAWYDPATLVGKKAIVVSNLKPAKLRGELSVGMLLSARVEEGEGHHRYTLVIIDDAVPTGSIIH